MSSVLNPTLEELKSEIKVLKNKMYHYEDVLRNGVHFSGNDYRQRIEMMDLIKEENRNLKKQIVEKVVEIDQLKTKLVVAKEALMMAACFVPTEGMTDVVINEAMTKIGEVK